LNVEEAGGWNSCWMPAAQVQLINMPLDALPVVKPVWPIEVFGLASPSASAKRNGNDLILSWKAVYMSLDEIRGYVLQVKLCQGGQLVSQYIFIPMTFAENKGTISYTLTDEKGCAGPSDVHIISYARRGFAYYYKSGALGWEKVFLPPHP
jgi:hypothetical protein